MQLHYGLDSFKKLSKAIVTSGTFDGVHMGHQTILDRLKEVARQDGGETVVLTFWPHPRIILFPDQNDLRLLTSLEEKALLLEKHGIDHLLVLPFSKEFSKTSSKDFIEIGTTKLVIGYDHRFGRNREGSFEYLKEHAHEWGFGVEEIPRHDVDNIGVSSTKIRQTLMESGDVDTASSYLGYHYMISGKVIQGERIGRTIGFPTANVSVGEAHKLIPANGVYAVTVEVKGKTHKGMLYIGPRPTIGSALHRTIEVNIFDFDDDIYNEQIRLSLHQKLRGDEKFDGLEALKNQLAADRERALKIL